MKKLMVALAVGLVAVSGRADEVITNFLGANYRMLPVGASDYSGLTNSVRWYCFSSDLVTQLDETDGAHGTGCYSQLNFAMSEALYQAWAAAVASNRPAGLLWSKASGPPASTGDLCTVYGVRVDLMYTGGVRAVR